MKGHIILFIGSRAKVFCIGMLVLLLMLLLVVLSLLLLLLLLSSSWGRLEGPGTTDDSTTAIDQ